MQLRLTSDMQTPPAVSAYHMLGGRVFAGLASKATILLMKSTITHNSSCCLLVLNNHVIL